MRGALRWFLGSLAYKILKMKLISKLVLFLVVAVVVGGAAALLAWDIPAPSETIEVVIPNERFN